MKKIFSRLMLIICFCIMCLFTGCSCEPPQYTVTVNFINADERLGLENFELKMGYGISSNVEFALPEGYDHTKITANFKGEEIPLEDWEVTFENEVEEEYQYSVGKTLKYKIAYVIEDLTFSIDMTYCGKEKFEIEFDNAFDYSYVRAVAINEDKLERLVVLDEETSIELSKPDSKKNKFIAEYGNYVALIYNKTFDPAGKMLGTPNKEYSSLYSDCSVFTDKAFKKSQGKLEYAEFPISLRGVEKYHYGTQGESNIFYIGQVKDNMKIYPKIPNFQEKQGFDLKEDYGMEKPNTFYLLSNMSDYSSIMNTIAGANSSPMPTIANNMVSFDFYKPTKGNYEPINQNMDQLADGTVLEKITALDSSEKGLYNRYDAYKVYVGDILAEDNLLTTNEKLSTYESLYIHVNLTDTYYQTVYNKFYQSKYTELINAGKTAEDAQVGAEEFVMHKAYGCFEYQIFPYEAFAYTNLTLPRINLVENSTISTNTGEKIPDIISKGKGNYYIKVDKEVLKTLILDRSYVDEYTSYDYKIGTGVLYISFIDVSKDDIDSFSETPEGGQLRKVYSKVLLKANFLCTIDIDVHDYQVFAYIDYQVMEGGVLKTYRDFGFIDYQYMKNSNNILVYFKTSLFVDDAGLFKDNIYIYVIGTKYENYATPRVSAIEYTDGRGNLGLTKEDPLNFPFGAKFDPVNNTHGIANFQFPFNDYELYKDWERHQLDEYVCVMNISMQQPINANHSVSFKYCDTLTNPLDAIYVTNNKSFEKMEDFTMVNSNRKHLDDLVKLGISEIYYFVISDNDIDFEVYMDKDNENTCITVTKTLNDITGKPITVDIGYGKPKEVKVKYVIPVFEMPAKDADGYNMFAK